jgi:hypothetical protein
MFAFLNFTTLFYFYSLGLILHDDAGRPILSCLLLSLFSIASLNPGLGRVHTSFLRPTDVQNPGFGRVHSSIINPGNCWVHSAPLNPDRGRVHSLFLRCDL